VQPFSATFLHLCTTAITDLSIEGISDECKMHRVNRLNAFLHNVIAILIFDALQHIALQLLGYLHLITVKSNWQHNNRILRWNFNSQTQLRNIQHSSNF